MLIDTTYGGTEGCDATVTMHLTSVAEQSLTDDALARIASNQHYLRWNLETSIGEAHVTAKALRSKARANAEVKRSGHTVTVLLKCFAPVVSGD